LRIVLCYDHQPEHTEQIAGAAPEAEIIDAGQARVATEILEADVFCGHAKVPMPWEQVAEAGRLKWIQSSAAGLDHCLVPPVIEYLDSLLVGSGNDLDLQTLKAVDQRSGRLLGVRADMTSQAARIDAHSLPVAGV